MLSASCHMITESYSSSSSFSVLQQTRFEIISSATTSLYSLLLKSAAFWLIFNEAVDILHHFNAIASEPVTP